MQNDRHWIHPQTAAKATFFLLASTLAVLLAGPAAAQVDPAAKADLTGDGTVNILDISTIGSRFGLQAGQEGYRGGLDLIPDGAIGMSDFMEVLSQFGTTGAPTTGTTFMGRVFDGLGNPLPGVRVLVGDSVEGCTDQSGAYAIPIGPADFGENLVTFDGSGGSLCTLVDPTPDFLSGQYPTIPNKPVFINAGIDNVFREIPLPERDLTNSQDLKELGVANDLGGNRFKLKKKVKVKNAGVKLRVPEGCTAAFPAGEDPVLSITRVDPARLPVPMPPGLSSSLFVTYQPGSTEIDCPAGDGIFTEFDNDDGFPVGPGDLNVGPFLAGITNGVFTPLVACEVLVGGATVSCGPIPTPFDFAWYHTDIRANPCPGTTVVGTVRLNDGPMTPVAGAIVSVPGVVPVTTGPDGSFFIPNVPAGPNGTSCFSNPFSLRATASLGGDFGASGFTPGVPGGITDAGDIKFGLAGTVQGRGTKLSSVNPFVVIPLEGANIGVDTVGFPACCPTTDANGNYNVIDVPSGGYNVDFRFSGELPEPGGSTGFKNFFDSQSGNIGFDGQIDVKNFRFTGTGAVRVTVVDDLGNAVPFVDIDLQAFGGNLGSGYVAPEAFCNGFTDASGIATISSGNFSCFSPGTDVRGVPMGSCEAEVLDFSSGTPSSLGSAGPEDGCFVNQHGQLVDLTIELLPPTPAPPGNLFGTSASDGGVLFVDTNDGSGSPLVSIGSSLPALAIDPGTGTLLGGGGGGNPVVFTIDAANGNSMILGDSGLGFAAIGGLDFCEGGVYASVNVVGDGGTGSDHLATIDVSTGAATLIGPYGTCDVTVTLPSDGSGTCNLEGMEAIACVNGAMVGATTTRGGPTVALWDIDMNTGAASLRNPLEQAVTGGPPSGGVSSLEFCDGILFGGTAREIGGAGDGGRLITIDPDTAEWDFVEPSAATDSGFGPSLGGLAGLEGCTAGGGGDP